VIFELFVRDFRLAYSYAKCRWADKQASFVLALKVQSELKIEIKGSN